MGRSVIITTNLAFDRWNEIFKDPMLTGAIVVRLAHNAHIPLFSFGQVKEDSTSGQLICSHEL